MANRTVTYLSCFAWTASVRDVGAAVPSILPSLVLCFDIWLTFIFDRHELLAVNFVVLNLGSVCGCVVMCMPVFLCLLKCMQSYLL